MPHYSHISSVKYVSILNLKKKNVSGGLIDSSEVPMHTLDFWMVTLSVFSSKREPGAGVINNCLRLWLGVQLVSGQGVREGAIGKALSPEVQCLVLCGGMRRFASV